MPNTPLPTGSVSFRNYYARFWREFSRDLFRRGRGQVIGAVLAILILFFQLYLGVIPKSLTLAAVKSVGWPYLLLIVIQCSISAIRAPVGIDRDRNVRITGLESEVARLKSSPEKPKLTPLQQHNYDIARKVIRMLPERAVLFLKYLCSVQKLVFGNSQIILPMMPDSEARTWCYEWNMAGLLTKEEDLRGGVTYVLAPDMKRALEELLFNNAQQS